MSRIIFVAILLIFSCEDIEDIIEPTDNSLDCNGVEGGDAELDHCNICDNDSANDCVQDCAGIWGGINICGCINITACNYDSTATKNDLSCVIPQGCNEWCEGDTTTVEELDCNDECGGSAELDNCDYCVEGSTGKAKCVKDCAGVWGGKQIDTDGDGICDAVYDIDSTSYKTIQIADQLWLSENLKVTHYTNGDEIQTGYSTDNLTDLTDGAYAAYDNVIINTDIYGNLYNWYAVNDTRGLCPEDWHVPSKDEFIVLTDYLGGTSVAGGKMKSTGTIAGGDGLWDEPNVGATNESGFTALPSGYYSSEGFKHLGSTGYFWSSTEIQAWGQFLDVNSERLIQIPSNKSSYYSIRCIKD